MSVNVEVVIWQERYNRVRDEYAEILHEINMALGWPVAMSGYQAEMGGLLIQVAREQTRELAELRAQLKLVDGSDPTVPT